jgi:predicted NAD/FAD-dependent oxidoreductase
MMDVAIVGAGLAGLACADGLVAAGHRATLFDKGRRAGGRMTTRVVETKAGPARFDIGAQYMTARDPRFRARVAAWAEAGLVAPWPAAGVEAWVGTPGMNAPVTDMAARHDVRWNARVDAIRREGGRWLVDGEAVAANPFDAVILAIPAEQAAALLQAIHHPVAARVEAARSAPCWTVAACYAERLSLDADVIAEHGAIGWAARDAAKPGRGGLECWVVQMAPDWSRVHLHDEPDRVTTEALALFEALAPGRSPTPLHAFAHSWRFARSASLGVEAWWDEALALGLCGDWLMGPRVENAWLSGTALAAMMGAGEP